MLKKTQFEIEGVSRHGRVTDEPTIHSAVLPVIIRYVM